MANCNGWYMPDLLDMLRPPSAQACSTPHFGRHERTGAAVARDWSLGWWFKLPTRLVNSDHHTK